MKRWVLPLVLAIAVCTAPAAEGVIGSADPVPAATLLYPYFEVDLANPTGMTTLLGLQNASATAALAHFVVWSDLGVPVLNFNVYLTGYDVQTINLRDILVNGTLPQTASAGQDPNDTISNKGIFSQDINFASCAGQLPQPPLPGSTVASLQAALTGQAAAGLGGLCAGTNRGDGGQAGAAATSRSTPSTTAPSATPVIRAISSPAAAGTRRSRTSFSATSSSSTRPRTSPRATAPFRSKRAPRTRRRARPATTLSTVVTSPGRPPTIASRSRDSGVRPIPTPRHS